MTDQDVIKAMAEKIVRLERELNELKNIPPDYVIIKTTTGDATGREGLRMINTFDNKYKVYADGAWRQLATW